MNRREARTVADDCLRGDGHLYSEAELRKARETLEMVSSDDAALADLIGLWIDR